MPPKLPPIAVTQAEAIDLIKSEKIFKRALRAGWIKPVVQGGLGRASIFDYGDIVRLWERLKTGEFPPKLPSELRNSVTKLLIRLWDAVRGIESQEPIYVFLSREDAEAEIARKLEEEKTARGTKETEEETPTRMEVNIDLR
jgi:predicted DNA-binding WGR domain protein